MHIQELKKELEGLQENNKWEMIINKLPIDFSNTEIWNDAEILGVFAFSHSRMLEPKYRKNNPNSFDKREKNFYILINRAIELKPKSQTLKSTLAYHYYRIFISQQNNKGGYYEKAKELYNNLVETSTEKYKESYRLARLNEHKFEIEKMTLSAGFFKRLDEILTELEAVVNNYNSLDDIRKKKYKDEYNKAIYAFCNLVISHKLNYWDIFLSRNLYKVYNKNEKYLMSDKYYNLVKQVDDYLNSLPEYTIKEKPNLLDVNYRKAQILQIKGLVYILQNADDKKALLFFSASNSLIYETIKRAKELKRNGANFLFPNYLNTPKARNQYLLNNKTGFEKEYYNPKPYELYDIAELYALSGNKEKSKSYIEKIPKNDFCYNKAQILLSLIKGE